MNDEIIYIIGALAGAGAFWKYLTVKAEHANELIKAEKADRAEFNMTLKQQVSTLNEKVDLLVAEKEELLQAIADLRAELADAKATIRHLEEVIRMRRVERD